MLDVGLESVPNRRRCKFPSASGLRQLGDGNIAGSVAIWESHHSVMYGQLTPRTICADDLETWILKICLPWIR